MPIQSFFSSMSTQMKLRSFLTLDSIIGFITAIIFIFRVLHLLTGPMFYLSFPIFCATIPFLYHFMRRNHNYRENRTPPKYVLENLQGWLIYRIIVITFFGVITLIILIWGLFLFLTEGAEAKKVGTKFGFGEKTSGIINTIFTKPLEYAALETFMLGILATGYYFMRSYCQELIAEYGGNFEAQMNNQGVSDREAGPEVGLLA